MEINTETTKVLFHFWRWSDGFSTLDLDDVRLAKMKASRTNSERSSNDAVAGSALLLCTICCTLLHIPCTSIFARQLIHALVSVGRCRSGIPTGAEMRRISYCGEFGAVLDCGTQTLARILVQDLLELIGEMELHFSI